jgi:hypothetical protein
MTAVCPHGFAAADCLICRTLGSQPEAQVQTSVRNLAAGPAGAKPAAKDLNSPAKAVRPDAVYSRDSGRTHLRPASHRLLVLVAALVAIGAAVWLLSGVAFAILHVLELLLVAAAAGWGGYRLGHWRGRHEPK